MPRKKKTPYQKIIHAARERRGTRLTAADCRELGSDHAIITVAERDDMRDEGEDPNDYD